MERLMFSLDAQRKIKQCLARYPACNYTVKSVHLTEENVQVSITDYNSLRHHIGRLESGDFAQKEEKLYLDGAENFGVAPSRFPYLCTEECTYETVLKKYLKQQASDPVLKNSNHPMVFALCVPDHPEWNDHLEKFRSWLDLLFQDSANLLPVVFSEAQILRKERHAQLPCLYISVDRRWTVFQEAESNGNGSFRKKICVGVGPGSEICNGMIRINRSAHSGMEWEPVASDSWIHTLTQLVEKQKTTEFSKAKYCRILAPEEYCHIVSDSIKLATGNSCQVQLLKNFTLEIAKAAAENLSGMITIPQKEPAPPKKSTGDISRKEMHEKNPIPKKNKEDIFSL